MTNKINYVKIADAVCPNWTSECYPQMDVNTGEAIWHYYTEDNEGAKHFLSSSYGIVKMLEWCEKNVESINKDYWFARIMGAYAIFENYAGEGDWLWILEWETPEEATQYILQAKEGK